MKCWCVVKADNTGRLINRIMGLDQALDSLIASHLVFDLLKSHTLKRKEPPDTHEQVLHK
jgi:hypothetical protein